MSITKKERPAPKGCVKLRPADAAAYLGMSPITLRNWRSIGDGPVYFRIGNRVFYAQPDLDSFLESKRVVPGGGV